MYLACASHLDHLEGLRIGIILRVRIDRRHAARRDRRSGEIDVIAVAGEFGDEGGHDVLQVRDVGEVGRATYVTYVTDVTDVADVSYLTDVASQ